MHLVLVGLSHHTAPLEVRERIGISRSMVPAALDRLANDGCDDAVLLSTCNRTEVYAVAADPVAMGDRVINCLADYRGVSRDDIDAALYVRTDADAARHLFRVAAGLDSLVVGEPEILGQVKDAYKVASEARGTGSVLNRLFHGAFAIGKRVRTDTGLSEGAVSLSYAALTLARKIFGDLASRHMVVFGAGEMSRLSALHFHQQVASTTIATRRQDRGEALASEVGGRVIAWDDRLDALAEADVLVSATGSPDLVLTAADLARVFAARRRRPMFVVDLAVPRDVDPDIAEREEVFLYNIDHLRGIVQENLARRQEAVGKAERLVNDEVAAWYSWLRSRAAIPTVVALRTRFERVRQAELERLSPKFAGLGPEARDRVDEVTRLMIEKLLLTPTEQLKAIDDHETMAACSAALRRLFALDDETAAVEADRADASRQKARS
ncbi:glutamyl-tRNA reductase [Luteitalea sp. TBR-22]|uniref:glutamyl-tRNA reductase n=1 Tax=Luteitalea sp. TBR-22 TaxID=2802971 RepID=UPI001AF27903|nr:glutamyl-tRNA reductase [Luteitalea sp. TBR-22]BCS35711.1 glutamyl-tRNA reductase [Luteitalea sp. TBR-22]